MIVVTGGAGFIGSNLVHALGARGRKVLVVDDLTDGTKYANIVKAPIEDYVDKERFLLMMRERDGALEGVEAILHQGACTSTTEWNGRYMLETNFEYSKAVLAYCAARCLPLVYASSAAVYGAGARFDEDPVNEAPLNVYGYSKLLFDQVIRRMLPRATSQIVGLRYFNVYGPRETHKGAMASVAFHLSGQLQREGKLRLFRGSDGYADGEQRRDFVYVDDVVAVNLWFLEHPRVSGIFNVGTGVSRSFNDVANQIIRFFGKGAIEYIPFPEALVGRYQSSTQADISRLRAAGCGVGFNSLESGMEAYMSWLSKVPRATRTV